MNAIFFASFLIVGLAVGEAMEECIDPKKAKEHAKDFPFCLMGKLMNCQLQAFGAGAIGDRRVILIELQAILQRTLKTEKSEYVLDIMNLCSLNKGPELPASEADRFLSCFNNAVATVGL